MLTSGLDNPAGNIHSFSACFSYLSMKEVTSVIKCFDLYYPEKNLMNLNHAMYPYFLHPMYKIIQLTTVFITMILRFK